MYLYTENSYSEDMKVNVGDIVDYSNEIIAAITKRKTFGRQAPDAESINVCYGFNDTHAFPMGVSLTSVAVNNQAANLHAHLFNSSISEGDVLKLETLVEQYPNLCISLYDVSETIVNTLPVWRDKPLAKYFRVMMPIILSNVDKILYLDSDIFCLGDISEVMRIDMEGKTALVVGDVVQTTKNRIEKLALKSGRYFNSGFMLIDVNKWNEHEVTKQFFALIAKRPPEFVFVDQDALNIILENNIKFIDRVWNFLPPADDRIDFEAFPNMKFVHCTLRKPWKAYIKSNFQPYFIKYKQVSPWWDTHLEYPKEYHDIRKYSKILFNNGSIKEAIVWYASYLTMKINAKAHKLKG